jgi:adenosylmethionine-8-amino-7-oxononanoate aminotransferase
MGAVLAHARVAEHLFAPGVVLPHGITFGGHPVSAAIALRNIEVFEREAVLEGARSRFAVLEREMRRLEELDVVCDVRGDGFFWAAELAADTPDGRLTGAHKTRVVKEVLPRELARVGLIARPDDRGEAVVQIAPPLVATEEQLRDVVDRLADAIQGAREEIRDPEAVRQAV